MREIIKMVVVLSVICAVSGFVLASVKQATRERIEVQELTYIKGPALASVMGQIDNDPILDRKLIELPDAGEILVFPGYKGGKLASMAFEEFGTGYGGPLGVMVGFDVAADTLAGIAVTTSKETPGVGSRASEPGFTGQFTGHAFSGLALKAGGGDIDAVSGATISSTAAVTAVDKALTIYKNDKELIIKALSQGASS